MIYFTSDLHLGHNAVISMQNRPFVDAEEMEEGRQNLLEHGNTVV